MSAIKLDITFKETVKKKLEKLSKDITKLPQEAYQEFLNITPVKSGNAKRNTKLHGNSIKAHYQYASVLDKGRHMTKRGYRGSDQAPDGMTKPTVDFIKKRLKQIVKGK